MVYRIYVEKKAHLAHEANGLVSDLRSLIGIGGLKGLRVINRYDVENIRPDLFEYAVGTVFSEPQLDNATKELTIPAGARVLAVEYLPGQFDQRADSAAQCIQIISQEERPIVRTAKIYIFEGKLSDDDFAAAKKYLINPVESREATLDEFDTLSAEQPIPADVATIVGFREMSADQLAKFTVDYGLAMDAADAAFCQSYFISEQRDPTITEIRMIDTYWSDHCRHTTFLTDIREVRFEDPKVEAEYKKYLELRAKLGREAKPLTLMDIATIGTRSLKADGKLERLDESEEINACTVKITVNHNGVDEDWLLLFKNETHNHPTEIEPFGGAATCIGGAIRDPLSGRAYVYAAMRVTGAADPLKPISETIPGKLPQRKIVTTAAAGYSSYGNQIGLATGMVDELYHDGYAAKRLEIGAVVGAAPAANVRREVPAPGDIVILLGGRTGRDGCGGATGSSKSHTSKSLESCGAEVQKGNAPEERKLQRLFRNAEASRLIKRCNDFGAGGVSVAIGELADGLEVNLDAVLKKYDGLDGTELAISESQERMAVVVEAEDAEKFIAIAKKENLEVARVATVTELPRLVMYWRGQKIVDVSREFLSSNGARRETDILVSEQTVAEKALPADFVSGYTALASDLNVCSKRGLSERFDSTIGAGSVLMPFGGKYQRTPAQVMAHKVSVETGDTDDCSVMAWGYNPYITEKSPYRGAYLAVTESIAKLVASGAACKVGDVFLTFQEYFEKPGREPRRWGKPLSALLGALRAQLDFEAAAIGGKDSMSGSFENLDVPPTLVSFAVTTDKTDAIISPEFKAAGHNTVVYIPEYKDGLPCPDSLKSVFAKVTALIRSGKAVAVWTPTYGGIAEGVLKMAIGNRIGFKYDDAITLEDIFSYKYGAFICELADNTSTDACLADGARLLGVTTDADAIVLRDSACALESLSAKYEDKLESVFSCNISQSGSKLEDLTYNKGVIATAPAIKVAKPRVLIPVFPGTNCEFDSAKAMAAAGADPEIFVIRNITASDIASSAEKFAKSAAESQMIFIPGGFSGGDEPDGSGKFITAFFRNADVKDAVTDLLDKRGGLMCGICNGFQALIKLGLVPYGRIIDTDENSPTLTFNTIARHQSKIVRTRIVSNLSPWLAETNPGDVYAVPISHGEGRFLASDELIRELAAKGQIATQYVDEAGEPTYDVQYNPNNSAFAIEGITSPDGRVFGKMGHSERVGLGLYKNVPGNYDIGMFRSAVKFFK